MGLISSRFEMMNESRCSWPCLQQSSFSTLAMNAFVRRFRERATPDGRRETVASLAPCEWVRSTVVNWFQIEPENFSFPSAFYGLTRIMHRTFSFETHNKEERKREREKTGWKTVQSDCVTAG